MARPLKGHPLRGVSGTTDGTSSPAVTVSTYAALRTALAAGTYQAGQMVFCEGRAAAGDGGAWYFQVAEIDGEVDDSWEVIVGGNFVARAIGGVRPALVASTYLAESGAVIAHRGGGALVSPDNVLSGYDYGVQNCRAVELDVWQTDDGQLLCMHDSTISRTTTGTGNTVDQTKSGIPALVSDPGSYMLAPGYVDEPVPTLYQALQRIDRRAIVAIEAKNAGALAGIVAECRRCGYESSKVLLQSSISYVAMAPYAADGWQCMYATNASFSSWSTLASNNIQFVGMTLADWTESAVAAAKSAGLITVAWTINRRVDRDAWIAIGGQAYFTDDPVYVMSDKAFSTRDDFGAMVYPPGVIESDSGARNSLVPPNLLSRASVISGFRSNLMGWACPINNDPNADDFTISFSLAINSVSGGDTTRWASVFICAPDDTVYTDVSPWQDGYHCLIRANGTLQIYSVASGIGATLAGTLAGTALTLGNTYDFEIVVTPSDVTLRNVTNDEEVNISNSAYRGGYFHFGQSSATVDWSSVVIW